MKKNKWLKQLKKKYPKGKVKRLKYLVATLTIMFWCGLAGANASTNYNYYYNTNALQRICALERSMDAQHRQIQQRLNHMVLIIKPKPSPPPPTNTCKTCKTCRTCKNCKTCK